MSQNILVVDDDPLTRRVVQHYLETAGYQVTTANTGREAIDRATEGLPQLIVLDLVLPDMEGSTVLGHLRNTGTTSAIPVIRMSGNADLLAQEQQSERSGLLAKPINAQQLLTLVRQLTPQTFEEDNSGVHHSP